MGDIVVVALALLVTVLIRSSLALEPFWQAIGTTARPGLATWDRNEWALIVFQAFAIPAALHAFGQYRLIREPDAAWSFNRVLGAVAASTLALLAILFVLRIQNVPRATLVLDFLLLVFLLAGWREAWAYRVRARHQRGEGLRNVLLLGSSELAQHVATHIATHPLSGRRVVGFLTNEEGKVLGHLSGSLAARKDVHMPSHAMDVAAAATELARRQPRHMLAPVATLRPGDLANALDGLTVEEVMIAPDVPKDVVREALTLCQARGIDTHLIPDHHQDLGISPRSWSLGPFTLLDVHRRPISRLGWMAKRGMDILGGIVGLLVFSPVILLTVLAIKLETPREPAFYPGKRVGLKGRVFKMAKFTTMRPDAQEIEKGMDKENQREGPWFKLEAEHDPRLTRVGRFIRKYSINEIPQFWNILKGDMSLVGPRPPITEEVARYVEFDFRYFRCLDVRPGLTGLWQVTCKNDPSFDRRIDLDIEYIENWSVWLDIKILFKTLWTVVAEPEE